MPKALSEGTQSKARDEQKLDWRKRISDHVAFGLLVYTGLHIFMTTGVLESGHGSAMPYFALFVLVGAIIPGCRWFEMRWEKLDDEHAADPGLRPAFRRDVALIWACAIGLPVLLTLGFKAADALF